MTVSKHYRGLPALLVAAVCLGALWLTAVSANAQARREGCEEYARESVEQAEANQRRNCGYEGPRWSDNRGGHFAWCALFPRAAEQELEARRGLLRECRSDNRQERREDRREGREERREERQGKRANCDTYAKVAEVQAEANEKYNCGNRGGEWSKDSRDHFRWCMRAKREYLVDELRYRTIELQKCFNNLGDFDEEGDTGYRRRRF